MLCPGCGKSVPLQDGKISLCDECRSNQPVHEVVGDTNERSPSRLEEEDISSFPVAGFWLRASACVIDFSLVYVFFIIFVIIFGVFSSLAFPSTVNFYLLIGGAVIYFIMAICAIFFLPLLFEISSMQGTIGKYLVGIMIVNEDGSKMGFLKAVGRSFFRSLSFLFLGIGLLFAASPPKKQAIHDMLFATKVVKFKEVPFKIIFAYLIPAVLVSLMIRNVSYKNKTKSALDSFTINFEMPRVKEVKNLDDSLNEIPKGSPTLIPSLVVSPSPVATKKKKEFADLPEFERRRIQAQILREGTAK